MPLKMTEKNIKDRLKEDTLDLSLCELKEVPVPKIAAVKKARNLDLSNNLLVTLPQNFIMLTNIVKLDLSKNMLIEIPENIGELKQLKHLDLYENQISRLPLSLSELKNLRWLDLKENPLTPAVASIAGPCSNSQECQACARNVVSYLEHVKLTIEEERLRRSNALATGQSDISTQVSTKKENKQKKKRSAESDKKKNMQNSEKSFKTDLSSNEKHTNESKTPLNGEPSHHSYTDGFCSMLGRCLAWIFLYLFIFGLSIVLILFLLSLYDSRKVNSMVEYLSDETGLFLKTYQVWNKDIWNNFSEIIKIWVDRLTHKINEYL